MTPDERYALRRFLSAHDEELKAWRALTLRYDQIIDVLKEEFWLAQDDSQTNEDDEATPSIDRTLAYEHAE